MKFLLLASLVIAVIAPPSMRGADLQPAAGGSILTSAPPPVVLSTTHNGIPFALHSLESTNYNVEQRLVSTYQVYQTTTIPVVRSVTTVGGQRTTNVVWQGAPVYLLHTQLVSQAWAPSVGWNPALQPPQLPQ